MFSRHQQVFIFLIFNFFLIFYFNFLVFSKGQLSGGDGVSYDFNMASLADHLKKQSEQGASTYYNIDIIKYEVRTEWWPTGLREHDSYKFHMIIHLL